MIETRVWFYLFFITFLESALQIRPSFHGHNNGFVQDENSVPYLLENIPMSMHKRNTEIDEKNVQDSIPYIQFEPSILDFKERQLGIPHQETVTIVNKDGNKTIHLSSISGSTQHFHSSFFQDKVIPPFGNTTFNVVFLGREEGDIDSNLYIHTSDGTVKYQVKGSSISSPYRLRPVVGVKLPLNASFTPLIYMHNPHNEAMQVIEVYSSGGEFQLELPTGEAEGPRELWEIPPYQTKPIIRLHFNAYIQKNHTAYIRFKVNNSAELMVVAVEVEVGSGAGFHWGGSCATINLGMGGSLQPSIQYPIILRNSAKKPVKILNIISTPVSKALKIEFEPISIPGDTEVPVTVGTLIYDWKTGLDLNHFKGKLVIKGLGPGGSSQKLLIPWSAEVLQGGLEVNTTVTHYCSPYTNQPRNFSVINRFKLPLAITNVTLANEAKTYFIIKNFHPRILKPGQKSNIFTLNLINNDNINNKNIKLESSILIYTNVSTTEVPLLIYDGKVKKIIPGERDNDKGTMNFGTVSSGSENEGLFALENQNPVNIELHGWGVNMPGAVLELMGCQNGPTDLFNKGIKNISVCSTSGNQSIKPGYLAIFKIKVKTPMVEEDTIVGDVFVRTTYERLTVPVYMRVAHGKISLKKLTFTDCFPGSICTQQIKIHSTFNRPMEVTLITPVNKDNQNRIKYIPLEESTLPIISKGDNNIGNIKIDPSISCKQHCYLGLSLNTSAGNQWFNTMSLPSHTRDSDLNLLNSRYSRYLNGTLNNNDNVTMILDTNEIRDHKFYINIKPYWPTLIQNSNNLKNKSILLFPLTQVGNTSYKFIKIYNPSVKPLFIQLVMDWNYPQGNRLYHSLPNKFKPNCLNINDDCPSSVDGEFKLIDYQNDQELFNKNWHLITKMNTLPIYLKPGESKNIKFSYTPISPTTSSSLLFIRNNMTILEVIRLIGRGAHAQFKFGNRKPGSNTPLLFELAEKHLKDCERERLRKNPLPNLTVKRSFTARNTGELPIDIYAFYISGLLCQGYGFKVLNCEPFKLYPNATKKIEIAFTPDFTLSKIERELFILTSLGSTIDNKNLNNNHHFINNNNNNHLNYENSIVKLSLLTTVPSHTLDICAGVLVRPSWEKAVHWAAISLSSILIICVFGVSFLEADRILRGALATMSRPTPIQPPLDLRQLAVNTSTTAATVTAAISLPSNNSLGKTDEKCFKKKDDSDWGLNIKRTKDKDMKNIMKIPPDWSPEEERKFKLDMGMKDIIPEKQQQDESIEGETNCQKKKKKQTDQIDDQEIDKKLTISSLLPRNKTKKEDKIIDDLELNESKDQNKRKISSNGSYKKYESNVCQKIAYSEEETSSTTTESSSHEDSIKDQVFKSEKLPRKTTMKKNKSQLNPVINSNTSDYKDNYEGDCDDDDYEKERQDQSSRWKINSSKPIASKINNNSNNNMSNVNSSSSSSSSSINSNGNSSNNVINSSNSGNNVSNNNLYQGGKGESNNSKPMKIKNHPKKDKTGQKRKANNDKPIKCTNNDLKSSDLNNRSINNNRISLSPLPSPQTLPPPPASCWGENRARFSDVVARNSDNTSPFSTNKSTIPKRQLNSHHHHHHLHQLLHHHHHHHHHHHFRESPDNIDIQNDNNDINNTTVIDYNDVTFNNNNTFSSSSTVMTMTTSTININTSDINIGNGCDKILNDNESDNTFHSDNMILDDSNYYHQQHHHQNSDASNSYFLNTFEPGGYEPELVPYDDLPETDEPLVELEEEAAAVSTGSSLWNDKNPMINILSDTTNNSFNQIETPKHINKLTNNLADTSFKDNWVAIDTNWEPLFNRGAVGEERSGIWGVNPGGVWAAAPWGAPTLSQPSNHQATDQNTQERSGFDPFRSLSTIWTPSTSNWVTKHEE